MSAAAKRSKTAQRLWTIFFTFIITLAFGAAVSYLDIVTKDRIAVNQKLFAQRAVREAAGLDKLPDSELTKWYEQAVTESKTDQGNQFSVRLGDAPDAGSVQVFERAGAGLWGQIRTAVGIANSDGEPRIAGFAVLDQVETPGLGARIAEPRFAQMLKGKSGKLKLVPEGSSASDSEIDALTGATITSTAVRDILNKSLQEVAKRDQNGEPAPEVQGGDSNERSADHG